MSVGEKIKILKNIQNCKIISINIVDRLIEFVYVKINQEKYIALEFDGVAGSMGRHYFFNIQSYKSNSAFTIQKSEQFELFENINIITNIELTKYEEYEYSNENIEFIAVSKDGTSHNISLYSDDEDAYIILDDVYYTYYNSNKDGLVWKN